MTLTEMRSAANWHYYLLLVINNTNMSQAFVKEEDDQWLHDVPGTLNALINYLSRENNGIRVYTKKTASEKGREVYTMSNGLQYARDANGKWEIV